MSDEAPDPELERIVAMAVPFVRKLDRSRAGTFEVRLCSPAMRGLRTWVCGFGLVVACGGDDTSTGDDTGATTAPATGTTAPTGADTTPNDDTASAASTDSGAMTTSVDSTGPGATDTTDTGMGSDSTGAMGDCQVWEITYDLEGSVFDISDTPLMAGDQANTVTMPYDADDTVGPGTFVLRFRDVDGSPGQEAAMVSYAMSMHFLVDSGVTTVATDLEAEAGPDECGVTTGAVAGTTVTWTPSAIVGHHSMGQILCNGGLCGAAGLPNGMPVPQDETTDQPVSDFVFAPDFSSFTMAPTVITMDDQATTSWSYTGTETGRRLLDAPACLCG